MNKVLLTGLLSLFLLPLTGQAQQITDGGMAFDSIPKNIVDHARLCAYYDMRFRKDSTDKDYYTEAQTVLLVGKSHLCFADLASLRMDSIIDADVRNHTAGAQTAAKAMAAGSRKNFASHIVTHLKKRKQLIQTTVFLDSYQYEQEMPAIGWRLLPGDTLIAGHPCGKAEGQYRGRHYTAYYAQDVELPFGPYVFGGLPGLIFQISDQRGDYTFTLNGLTQETGNSPIYCQTGRSWRKSTREKVRQAEKNFCNHPDTALSFSGIEVTDGGPALPPKPYNPIELE